MHKTKKAASHDTRVTERVLDSLDTCIYVSDLDTYEILFINDKMSQVFGGEDLTGKICWQVLQTGMDGPCSFCPCAKLRADPTTPVVWEEHNTLTGLYYKNTDTIIDWVDGTKVHVQNSLDITDLKLTQAALHRQVSIQALEAEISMDFAATGGLEKNLNRSLCLIGEFFGTNRVAIMRWDEVQQLMRYEYEWASGCPPYIGKEFQYRQLDPDGNRYEQLMAGLGFVTETDLPLTDVNGEYLETFESGRLALYPLRIDTQLWGVLAVHNPVSDEWDKEDFELLATLSNILTTAIKRKRTEDDLFVAEQTLRNVLDHVPVSIFWKDLNSLYIGCNAQFADLVNMTAEQLIGTHDSQLFPPALAAEYIAEDAEVVATKKPLLDMDREAAISNGTTRWMRRSKVPIFDQNGQVTGTLGILQDVTEAKLSEIAMIERDAELERVLRIAEKSDKAKSEFLSRMSHEIRTPMNAIIGMTRIASTTTDLNKIAMCFSRIDSASKQLMAIINDILDMAKIEAGKLEINPDEFNMEKMLMDVCNLVLVKSDEKQQTLRVNIARKVPNSYYGDEYRLSQVLTNLLTNAVKFTPDGGEISLDVVLRGVENEIADLEFTVADNGIGISEEQQQRLFASFEQANGGIARKYGGTGLGLAICKRIVELMDGEIHVESREDEGSKFIFNVKLKILSSSAPSTDVLPAARENLHVLIVDDSPETCEYFLMLMNEYNISADAAESGFEALRLIETAIKDGNPYTVIFVDWRMPDMDGIETTRRIKETYGDQSIVILISVSEWTNIAPEAGQVGIDQFLSKPLFPSTIINTINEVTRPIPKAAKNVSAPSLPDFRGKRILMAEDVEINQDILQALLEDTGVQISFANNGIEAVEKFTRNAALYDLILMDIHMPDMDGFEATRRIRALPIAKAQTIPILAMTANVFVEDIQRCLEAGMNDHLGKPVDVNRLMSKLQNYLMRDTSGSVSGGGVAGGGVAGGGVAGGGVAGGSVANGGMAGGNGNASIPASSIIAPLSPASAPSSPAAPSAATPPTSTPVVSMSDYKRYLPYIDVEKGLSRIRNNRKLYVTMLRSFQTNTLCDELMGVIAQKDMEKAQYVAHTFKGVAGNLSLEEIYQIVTPFESMLKHGQIQNSMPERLADATATTQKLIVELIAELNAEANT